MSRHTVPVGPGQWEVGDKLYTWEELGQPGAAQAMIIWAEDFFLPKSKITAPSLEYLRMLEDKLFGMGMLAGTYDFGKMEKYIRDEYHPKIMISSVYINLKRHRLQQYELDTL